MILGQFSQRGSVKCWQAVPIFKGNDSFSTLIFMIKSIVLGIAIGQLCGTACISTYYCSLIALTLFYMIKSFAAQLPWSFCWSQWKEKCVDASALIPSENRTSNATSSSELYFL
jgi:solute carrier family 6 amino acid transporter-like protein 5/7/9/14